MFLFFQSDIWLCRNIDFKIVRVFLRQIPEPSTVPYWILLCGPRGLRKRGELECSHGPVGHYAHTFLGKASFWSVREFLPQWAVSDSVKNIQTLLGQFCPMPRVKWIKS